MAVKPTIGLDYMKKIALLLAVLAVGLLVSCKKNNVKVNIELNPEELVFSSEAGSKTVEVTCNSSWNATLSATTWAAIDFDGSDIQVSVLTNTGAQREADIVVTSGDVSKTVKITQQAPPP